MTEAAVENLTVIFEGDHGSVAGLRNLNLRIGERRIVGLVGESGSGKSTAALALLGLLAANGRTETGILTLGNISYDLTRTEALLPLRGQRVAMVFQDPFTSLNPVFPIETHLNEVITRRDPRLDAPSRRREMIDALASVGLADPETRLRQFPFQLSGGMRQRVAIAMALLARPDLLIADEPTTALDATVEAQVMAEICALRDRIGCSIILITHSLGLVSRYCDDMAVLYAGEMVEAGPTSEIVRDPRHPYTRALLACEVGIDDVRAEPSSANRFRIIPGDLPPLTALPKGCIYCTRCDRKIGICDSVPPAVSHVGPGHSVSCHLQGPST